MRAPVINNAIKFFGNHDIGIFTCDKQTHYIELFLFDIDSKTPLINIAYTLAFETGEVLQGFTNQEGILFERDTPCSNYYILIDSLYYCMS